jgi:tetratricopeptide (TPR) repeat protein
MWTKLALITFLLTGLVLADDRSEYELLKLKISEQRRVLGRHHHDRQYTEAMEVQKEIAELSRQALAVALESPDIQDSGAWNHHANVLRDAGYTEEALEAVDQYMKTPLLKRNGFREGWTKRADIYKRQLDFNKAHECLGQALEYADSPRERFHILKSQANLYLKQAQPQNALAKVLVARKLISKMDENRRLNAERDVQSIFVKVYRDLGAGEKAREAKWKELEFRRELLDQEIERFNSEYPQR